MTRTSARKPALKARASLREEDTDSEDDAVQTQDDEEESEHEAPSPKKRRVSTATRPPPRPKIKGALRDFLDLPLELVLRILGELDLPTRFHLSRLSKRFWRLLRGDKSLHILWTDAPQSSGITKPAAHGMSVYQQANLMFGCCQGCGKTTNKVDWALWIRACPPCYKDLVADKQSAAVSKEVLEIAPFSQSKSRFARYPISPILADGEYSARLAVDSAGNDRKTKHYSVRELRHVEVMLQDVVESQTEALDIKEDRYEYWDSDSEDDDGLNWTDYGLEMLAFDYDCFGPLSNICSKGDLVFDLTSVQDVREAREEKRRTEERQKILKTRRKDIMARFEAEGYKAHHFQFDAFTNHPTMRVAKELTDSAFASVHVKLGSLLAAHRHQQDVQIIAQESGRLRGLVSHEYNRLRRDKDYVREYFFDPVPDLNEFIELEPVKAMYHVASVDEIGKRTPPPIADKARDIARAIGQACEAAESAFFRSFVNILADIETARKANPAAPPAAGPQPGPTIAQSVASIAHPLQLLPADVDEILQQPELYQDDLLLRAICFVQCIACTHVNNGIDILTHKCSVGRHSIRANGYQLMRERIEAAIDVVLALKQDFSATAEDIDGFGHVLHCECASPALAHDWRYMVLHRARHHRTSAEKPAIVVDTQEGAMKRVFEQHIESLGQQSTGYSALYSFFGGLRY
ncbi:hypothetical protein JCM10296v2_001309 [Rhodotorula toruloides]